MTNDIVEVKDTDGHKFLIPTDQVSEFNKILNRLNDISVFTDEYGNVYNVLWNRFGKYAV